jgi:hypothetical protein
VLGMAALTEPSAVSGTAIAFGATRVTQLHSLLTDRSQVGQGSRAVDTCTSTNTKDLGVGSDVNLVQWTSPFPDQ